MIIINIAHMITITVDIIIIIVIIPSPPYGPSAK